MICLKHCSKQRLSCIFQRGLSKYPDVEFVLYHTFGPSSNQIKNVQTMSGKTEKLANKCIIAKISTTKKT